VTPGPLRPPRPPRRDPNAIIAGAILSGAGVASFGVALAAMVVGQTCQPSNFFDIPSCHTTNTAKELAIGSSIAGGALLLIGIPVLIYGASRAPAPASSALQVRPTADGGLALSF
jgi:hypothetical protein